MALVGLHCCGDLSADAIRIFLSIPSLSLLALVPCCFHKASLPNASMSGTGVAASPFMRRLAVQDSFSKWKAHTESEHERHMRVFGYRAILEDFIRDRDISVDKKRRRGRRTDSTETFKSWLSANFVITGEYDEEQLESCARKYSQVLPVLEFITGGPDHPINIELLVDRNQRRPEWARLRLCIRHSFVFASPPRLRAFRNASS